MKRIFALAALLTQSPAVQAASDFLRDIVYTDFAREILVGPVIGLVKSDSARVLMEFNTSANRSVKLSATGVPTVTSTKAVTQKVATIFTFSGLVADTKYDVKVYDENDVEIAINVNAAGDVITSSLRTYPVEFNNPTYGSKTFKWGTLSCNKASVLYQNADSKALWGQLRDRAKNDDIQAIFHSGDQVYQDSFGYYYEARKESIPNPNIDLLDAEGATSPSRYHRAMKIFLDQERAQAGSSGDCSTVDDMFRQVYRDQWALASVETREALANVANLMMPNDHDIVDDLGTFKDVDPPNTMWYQVRTKVNWCVYQTLADYQYALAQDVAAVPALNNPRTERFTPYFFQILSGVGVYFMDTALDVVFHQQYNKNSAPLLGTRQRTDVTNAFFGLGGSVDFTTVNQIVVVLPTPLYTFGPKTTEILGRKAADDFSIYLDHRDMMMESAFISDTFFTWRDQAPERNIVLVAGNPHMSGFTEIKPMQGPLQLAANIAAGNSFLTNNKPILHITSSGIANVMSEGETKQLKSIMTVGTNFVDPMMGITLKTATGQPMNASVRVSHGIWVNDYTYLLGEIKPAETIMSLRGLNGNGVASVNIEKTTPAKADTHDYNAATNTWTQKTTSTNSYPDHECLNMLTENAAGVSDTTPLNGTIMQQATWLEHNNKNCYAVSSTFAAMVEKTTSADGKAAGVTITLAGKVPFLGSMKKGFTFDFQNYRNELVAMHDNRRVLAAGVDMEESTSRQECLMASLLPSWFQPPIQGFDVCLNFENVNLNDPATNPSSNTNGRRLCKTEERALHTFFSHTVGAEGLDADDFLKRMRRLQADEESQKVENAVSGSTFVSVEVKGDDKHMGNKVPLFARSQQGDFANDYQELETVTVQQQTITTESAATGGNNQKTDQEQSNIVVITVFSVFISLLLFAVVCYAIQRSKHHLEPWTDDTVDFFGPAKKKNVVAGGV